MTENTPTAKLLYMGHASLRITTPEGKVIYIDPYAGDGYGPQANMILLTHAHFDHTVVSKIAKRAPDCRVISWQKALVDGEYQTFKMPYVTVEAVQAGNNANHDIKECVGFVLTLSNGITVYVSGDTSKTAQMASLADKHIDYAFFCCDGVYNMDLDEAAECAQLVGAKHNIPYHVIAAKDGVYFDRERAEAFAVDNRLILEPGQEIELK
ncbi:MAG: MBL fold metallo-hydrolase [Clostridia bacterium]|nr:MBL fold metallo-hydrolase [Clostridia bacterium]